MQSPPILACLPGIRRQVRRLTESFFPNLVVVSHNEIVAGTPIESVGVLRLNEAQAAG